MSFGGINAAGRSSFHHAFHRLVLDSLPSDKSLATIAQLARLMNLGSLDRAADAKLIAQYKAQVCAGTLIREMRMDDFIDPLITHQPATIEPVDTEQHDAKNLKLSVAKYKLSSLAGLDYKVLDQSPGRGDDKVDIQIRREDARLFLACIQESKVNTSAQLPQGFSLDSLYPARNHPKALQMALFGVSDVLHALGVDLAVIKSRVRPDEIAVYVSNSTGQLDKYSLSGVFKSFLLGKRINSKQLPFSYAQMPADFINAYVLGSVGKTGACVGACATFLYNLARAIEDIKSGQRRFVIVGTVDAPIQPEIIESFRVMGALAEDSNLRELDGLSASAQINHRFASRPFGENAGFVLAEASQFIILADDQLVMELGLDVYGSVADVFVHADGYKHSITSPGVGNYLTVAQSCAAVRALLGEKSLQRNTCMFAHGTSTPQNRVTESHILSSSAEVFGIRDWPVLAVKSLLGHSQGTAAGDQLVAALGIWDSGFFPGIRSIDHLAEDVHKNHLDFVLKDQAIDARQLSAAFINTKGFGGNNATAVLLAPHVTQNMLLKRYGKKQFSAYMSKREQVQVTAVAYDQQASQGKFSIIYDFGQRLTTNEDVKVTGNSVNIAGYDLAIEFAEKHVYGDMI